MAAAHQRSQKVLILEHNSRPGARIAISGGGRCNITNQNLSPSCYLGDPKFVEKVLNRFDNEALLAFLRRYGLEPVVRKEHRYFCPNRAQALTDLLLQASSSVEISYETEIFGAEKSGNLFVVKTSKGEIYAKKLLIATGGLSYPSVGASGIGYKIAESFGHRIVPLRPALVGLTLQSEQAWMNRHCAPRFFIFLNSKN